MLTEYPHETAQYARTLAGLESRIAGRQVVWAGFEPRAAARALEAGADAALVIDGDGLELVARQDSPLLWPHATTTFYAPMGREYTAAQARTWYEIMAWLEAVGVADDPEVMEWRAAVAGVRLAALQEDLALVDDDYDPQARPRIERRIAYWRFVAGEEVAQNV